MKKNIQLTKRELEVLTFINRAIDRKNMAAIMGISINTLDKHIFKIHRKTNTHSTAELIIWCIENGYFSLIAEKTV